MQLALDRLASVNQTLGRSHGDDLLRSAALALESALRQGDTIARLGDDEVFSMLLPGIKSDADLTVIADKLSLALRSPFSIGGHELTVTASIGIALFPDDGPDADSLLQAANASLQQARARGGDGWEVHAPRARALATARHARESALRRAMARGELALCWQPVVECETGRIAAMESQLRWRSGRQAASPADFVSPSDAGGLAVPLGQWARRAACRQGKSWRQAGHLDLVVSVAVSLPQLAHPALVKLVRRVLTETELPPDRLELAVSEADLGRAPEAALERLDELRRLGIRIALDRFGGGESRLASVLRLPIDTVKIAATVLHEAVDSRQQEAVISAAIALARSRQLRVVARGVDSEAQRAMLVRCHCDEMQGRLSGAPLSVAEADALLEPQRPVPSEEPSPSRSSR